MTNFPKIKWAWGWWEWSNKHYNECMDPLCRFCNEIERFKEEFRDAKEIREVSQ